jgi:hypothetical protein
VYLSNLFCQDHQLNKSFLLFFLFFIRLDEATELAQNLKARFALGTQGCSVHTNGQENNGKVNFVVV